MTTLTEEIDIQKQLNEVNLKYGVDYLSFLDSTMARFWYYSDQSRTQIREILSKCDQVDLLSDETLKSWGVYYSDKKYGEDIFLTKPGIQITPSDMGAKSLPGMHGYTPEHPDSDAMWMSNYEPSKYPNEVKDIFNCMEEKVNEIIKERKT